MAFFFLRKKKKMLKQQSWKRFHSVETAAVELKSKFLPLPSPPSLSSLPTKQHTLNKLRTALRRRNLVNKQPTEHASRGPKRAKKKCMRRVRIPTELPSCVPPVGGWASSVPPCLPPMAPFEEFPFVSRLVDITAPTQPPTTLKPQRDQPGCCCCASRLRKS